MPGNISERAHRGQACHARQSCIAASRKVTSRWRRDDKVCAQLAGDIVLDVRQAITVGPLIFAVLHDGDRYPGDMGGRHEFRYRGLDLGLLFLGEFRGPGQKRKSSSHQGQDEDRHTWNNCAEKHAGLQIEHSIVAEDCLPDGHRKSKAPRIAPWAWIQL